MLSQKDMQEPNEQPSTSPRLTLKRSPTTRDVATLMGEEYFYHGDHLSQNDDEGSCCSGDQSSLNNLYGSMLPFRNSCKHDNDDEESGDKC